MHILANPRLKGLVLAALLAITAVPALARTDFEGCVSTKVIIETWYASYIWYDPDTGEICSDLDCGGGRSPPKTTVPGCPLYRGTATVTPSYLPGFGPDPGSATAGATVPPSATAPGTGSEPIAEGSSATVPPSGAITDTASITGTSAGSQATSSLRRSGDTSSRGTGGGSSSASAATTASTPSAASTTHIHGTLYTVIGVISIVAGWLSIL
ncbi:hypothetical protein VTK73DRAFT_8398 [Phialemonium thermophilum]|uniref:Siderophore biosynthesis n=1 Tax=Phialemonium thermophilum TaxID=223376 RepID=A0ABR3W8U5_9PEZI